MMKSNPLFQMRPRAHLLATTMLTSALLSACGESGTGATPPQESTTGMTSSTASPTGPVSTSSAQPTSTSAESTTTTGATTTDNPTTTTAPATTAQPSTTTTSSASTGETSSTPMTSEAGESSTDGPTSTSETTSEPTTPSAQFTLTSPDHQDGAVFAPEVTCEACGFDANKMIMPSLEWTAGPAGTMSYALVFIDTTLYATDDPLGNHWALWNIPASTVSLPKSMKMADIPAGATQTGNFLGPCPSFGGTATHDYAFTLYALPTAMAEFDTQGQATQVVGRAVEAFEAQALAKAELTGVSSAAAGQGGAGCN